MRDTMPSNMTEFERYLIERLDRIEEKLTDVRIKVASIAIIVSLVTAVITSVLTTTVEKRLLGKVDSVSHAM